MLDDWIDFGITVYYYGTVVPHIRRMIATESYEAYLSHTRV